MEYCRGRLRLLAYGMITTAADMEMPARLLTINRDLLQLIEEIQPDAVAVEQLYYHKNSKTVITVAQSRGVVLLTSAQAGVHVAEYTPLQVKQAVVGYGGVTKTGAVYGAKAFSLEEPRSLMMLLMPALLSATAFLPLIPYKA